MRHGPIAAYLLSVALGCFLFFTCKKGPDDPAVSLLSRKARFAGDWRLKSGHMTIESHWPDSTLIVQYDLQERNVTITLTINGSASFGSSPYSLQLVADKKGDLSVNERIFDKEINATGRWSFNAGIGESKKKADVFFLLQKVTKGETFGNHLFNKLNTNFEYSIRELRDKKLVLETSSYIYINADGDYDGIRGTLTFEQ
jgi:hypothetical protein